MSRCIHGAACIHCTIARQHTPAAEPALPRLLVTFDEAADLLGVSKRHVYQLISDAGLDGQVVHIGRGQKLRRTTLDELIDRNTQAAAS